MYTVEPMGKVLVDNWRKGRIFDRAFFRRGLGGELSPKAGNCLVVV
jgi:hypothetical protein